MEAMGEARTLIQKVEQALKDKGKTIDKADKKQIKADVAALNKALFKCKPDKMNENDLSNLRAAISKLEGSAASILQ